jgi:hypothetical protein
MRHTCKPGHLELNLIEVLQVRMVGSSLLVCALLTLMLGLLGAFERRVTLDFERHTLGMGYHFAPAAQDHSVRLENGRLSDAQALCLLLKVL